MWLMRASAMMERQEFPVQRTRTLVGLLGILDEDDLIPIPPIGSSAIVQKIGIT
jgi:hypothetical protein